LGGEVLQQRDLLVGERSDFTTVYRNEPEQWLVLAQRRRNKTAGSGEADQRLEAGSEADNLGFGEVRYRD
jgi:hypothetical protein